MRGTGDRTGSFRMRKTGKRLMLRTLHLAHSVAAASVRVYNLTTEGKEFLPGSSLNHLGYGSRDHDLSLFLVFALWLLIFQWFSCLAQLHLHGRG